LPSQTCVNANAHALGHYAALCQEQDIVPIVEPEVLMEGVHTIDRCDEVTGVLLHAVFNALHENRVLLEGMLLKPNMVMPGSVCPVQASVPEVADATLQCLRCQVPAAVPGVVFLSGGQSDVVSTKHLNAISQIPGSKPWKIIFSYGRALQDLALVVWSGNEEKYRAAQQAHYHRDKCNVAAGLGKYNASMESTFSAEVTQDHNSDCADD